MRDPKSSLAKEFSESGRPRCSLDDLIRECLESRLHEPKRAVDWKNDPFLSDREVYKGPTPPDLVERLDDYLYGDED